MPSRVILQDLTGVPGRRRPGGHARRDGGPRRRPGAGQPARPGGPRHRPLGPGGPVRDAGRVRLQRRARVRAQRRALPAPALGADGVPRPARRAARDRHRPPGQPRVPRARSSPTRDGRARAGRLPRHGRRDRLAHDDDQRRSASWATASAASRPRPCCSASRSTSRCRTSSGCACRRAAARLDRDRPRPRRDRDAARATASSGRSSSSPATASPACPSPTGPRSAT